MIIGIHHKMANKYMLYYANEIAWREDNRRTTDKDKFNDILQRCIQTLPSRNFIGYWQGNKKAEVILELPFALNNS